MASAEAPTAAGSLHVEVAYSPRAGVLEHRVLELPVGTTLQQALDASGLARQYPEIAALPCGIWGRVQAADTPLRDRDRVEVYRPLLVDPKEARRLRYRKQGRPRDKA